MATFFNALGALGSGIKQARQERMEGEQQELGKLFQLFQLNESRKNEAKQDWLDRQYERQRTGGELTDDDLEIKHRFESARDYGKQIESQMALNIGGPRGKGLVQGRLSGLAKAFGIDHKEDLPDLAGGFGGGSFGAGGSSSASPQSVEASQSGAPPSSMGMGGPPPSVSQSDSLPSAPGGGVSPLAARLASSWGDPLNDVRTPGGPVFTPGSVGGSPGGTQEGPVPAAPFAFSQYPQPMSPGAIEQRAWRNAYVPGMPIDRIGLERNVADQQRFHAQQLLDMVGDYVQHIHANERPGEQPRFSEAMKDPRFAQLEGALRQAQAAKIYVNGKPEDLLRAGTIHDTLKSYFSDYERPEDRGKKTVEQQIQEAALPGLNQLGAGKKIGDLSATDQAAVRTFERHSRLKGGNPLNDYYQHLLDRGVPEEEAAQKFVNIQAGKWVPQPGRPMVTQNPITGDLQYEAPAPGTIPKGTPPPKANVINTKDFMHTVSEREAMTDLLKPKVQRRGKGAGESFIDPEKVIAHDISNPIPADKLEGIIQQITYPPDKKRLNDYYLKRRADEARKMMTTK